MMSLDISLKGTVVMIFIESLYSWVSLSTGSWRSLVMFLDESSVDTAMCRYLICFRLPFHDIGMDGAHVLSIAVYLI